MNEIITKIVGVTFRDAQKNIKTFGCKDIGSYGLYREPDNSHDPNAIKVALCGIIFMGYVPRDIAKDLAPMMDEGKKFLAYFVSRNESPKHKTVGLTVRIADAPWENEKDGSEACHS